MSYFVTSWYSFIGYSRHGSFISESVQVDSKHKPMFKVVRIGMMMTVSASAAEPYPCNINSIKRIVEEFDAFTSTTLDDVGIVKGTISKESAKQSINNFADITLSLIDTACPNKSQDGTDARNRILEKMRDALGRLNSRNPHGARRIAWVIRESVNA